MYQKPVKEIFRGFIKNITNEEVFAFLNTIQPSMQNAFLYNNTLYSNEKGD